MSARTKFACDGNATACRWSAFVALRDVCRLFGSFPWLILVCAVTIGPPASAAAPRNVLVVYSFSRLLPGNIEGDRGLTAGFDARPDVPVAMFSEFFDNPRFSSEAYERAFVTYLHEKYAEHPPEVIIAVANEAMDFMLRHRAELFPQVPIVHMAVSSTHLPSISPLPPDVVGTPLAYDFVSTVDQALRWRPKASRLVVVTGASPWDLEWEARTRAEAAGLANGLSIDFWSAFSIEDLQERLRALRADSIVFTPGFFRDGSGRAFVPRETAQLIAAASPVPVYGPFSSFIGTGVVGGRMTSFDASGRHAAQTALALLDGASATSLALPASMPAPLQVDWRELRRWGIDPQAVPADAIVHFRNPRSGRATANRCSSAAR